MGPRPFSRGNFPQSPGAVPIQAGFNGATAFQPWKRAAAELRRNSLIGFNGATAFQPWKHARLPAMPLRWFLLQWGHGLSAVETGPAGP